MPEMRNLICPGPPEHEFQIPKGRGRPPKYCDEHKGNGKASNGNGNSKTEGSKMESSGAPRARPKPSTSSSGGETQTHSRPRPPKSDGAQVTHSEETGSDPGLRKLPPPGSRDTQSRAKAERAADRTASQVEEVWPRGSEGRPMARIEFSASELIPTGQYANVSVGPARITAFIDLDRELGDDEGYFTADERTTIIQAANELAELVERDVIAVQRNLVLESMQEQLSANGK